MYRSSHLVRIESTLNLPRKSQPKDQLQTYLISTPNLLKQPYNSSYGNPTAAKARLQVRQQLRGEVCSEGAAPGLLPPLTTPLRTYMAGLGLILRGVGLIINRFRIDLWKKYMAGPINWGSFLLGSILGPLVFKNFQTTKTTLHAAAPSPSALSGRKNTKSPT